MLSGGFFDDDPFFAGHRQQMSQMNQMFSPFGFPPGGMLALGAPQPAVQMQQRVAHRPQQQQQQLAPMDLFSFGGFGNMFQNMRRMMDDMHTTLETGASNPNGQMYSQSTFMSYSNVGGPGAQPKVYHASSSTVQGPGGVRETRKMVRDSESGVEKMSMGRHLGSRGHVVERQRNRRTGDREENQEYINIDEEEAPEFNREWQEQSRGLRGAPGRLEHRRQDRADRRFRALPAPGQRHIHGHTHSHGHGHHQTNHTSTGQAGQSTHSTPRTPSYRDRE